MRACHGVGLALAELIGESSLIRVRRRLFRTIRTIRMPAHRRVGECDQVVPAEHPRLPQVPSKVRRSQLRRSVDIEAPRDEGPEEKLGVGV